MVNRSFSLSLTYITYVARKANVADDSRLWHKRLLSLRILTALSITKNNSRRTIFY